MRGREREKKKEVIGFTVADLLRSKDKFLIKRRCPCFLPFVRGRRPTSSLVSNQSDDVHTGNFQRSGRLPECSSRLLLACDRDACLLLLRGGIRGDPAALYVPDSSESHQHGCHERSHRRAIASRKKNKTCRVSKFLRACYCARRRLERLVVDLLVQSNLSSRCI